jgi:hypothetical protein
LPRTVIIAAVRAADGRVWPQADVQLCCFLNPAYAGIERQLAMRPPIKVPTITLDGADDGVRPPSPASAHARLFTAPRNAVRSTGRRELRVSAYVNGLAPMACRH